MAILHEFGMTWGDVVLAAIEVNAQILGDSRLGKITPGAFADFVVFAENPQAIGGRAYEAIEAVFVSGDLVL